MSKKDFLYGLFTVVLMASNVLCLANGKQLMVVLSKPTPQFKPVPQFKPMPKYLKKVAFATVAGASVGGYIYLTNGGQDVAPVKEGMTNDPYQPVIIAMLYATAGIALSYVIHYRVIAVPLREHGV